jgi:hypothetical protein
MVHVDSAHNSKEPKTMEQDVDLTLAILIRDFSQMALAKSAQPIPFCQLMLNHVLLWLTVTIERSDRITCACHVQATKENR